ncbi:cupin domain-containing protein [Leptobacterium flavescens]|uniref:Cupin domain-containing protein n=1 Tax=Leptobacterium flavescens TaxID=472055 RepID=A0A6P0US15_9FLAO|nr:cupin domain-containing protein [Leptobacterium flavescens]NER13663.1 cupin domain-containing protein [Leptobacterium flavescens]
MIYRIEDIEAKELLPGFSGRFVHGENSTLAFWDIKEGAALPAHSHHHEQTSQVLEGRFELTVNGESRIYEPGTVVVIPSHAEHSGRALTDCKILDTFCPAREEYK